MKKIGVLLVMATFCLFVNAKAPLLPKVNIKVVSNTVIGDFVNVKLAVEAPEIQGPFQVVRWYVKAANESVYRPLLMKENPLELVFVKSDNGSVGHSVKVEITNGEPGGIICRGETSFYTQFKTSILTFTPAF
ncbi:MAG: hypothetical protein N4A72_20340 [Bacteroidales bacterium]|jgi:hypothetical protein|nr:hypothetical protein [Bacteroidales bacterium]